MSITKKALRSVIFRTKTWFNVKSTIYGQLFKIPHRKVDELVVHAL